jgi:hypothetical protein
MGYKKGYYKKDGTYVQGHYTSTKSKSYLNKNNKGCTGIFVVLTIFGLAISCSEQSNKTDCPSKNCSDFSTQAQAQSTYNSDKDCYKNLDADNDGTACENLPK